MKVRHPLERLLSAYRDKLESGNNTHYHAIYGKVFFHFFKGEVKQTVSQVSWRQFVTLVLSTSIEQVFCQTQADHNQLELSNSIIINSAQSLMKNVQTLHLGR